MSKHDKYQYSEAIVDEQKTAIVVYSKKTKIVLYLIQLLEQYFTVYESSSTTNIQQKKFDHYVFVDSFPKKTDTFHARSTYVIIRFFLPPTQYEKEANWCKQNIALYKYVNIGITGRSVDEVLQFILFKTPTPYNFDYTSHTKQAYKNSLRIEKKREFPWKTIPLLLGFGVVAFFVLLIVLELGSGWFVYQLRKGNLQEKRKNISQSKALYTYANILMNAPKQTLFWVPGIELVFDTHEALGTTIRVADEGLGVIEQREKEKIAPLLSSVDKAITSWERPLLPGVSGYRKQAVEFLSVGKEYLQIGNDILSVAPKLFGKGVEKKYLLLFMNNMELRPGGGFIGSLGVLKIKDYAIKDIKIYDVYSIDGQLKTHFDPPTPIRTFLQQPHWFLRDSNTSPDFTTSATNALVLLDSSVGWKNFDGVIGITYSSFASLLSAFPDFSIPDYKEMITEDTFFQKAHQSARKDFFSGSHGKRNFLQAVATMFQIRFIEGDYNTLALLQSIRKSLDEKQVVLSFSDPELQAMVQKYFWGGQMTPPECITPDPCVADYLSIVDMNLGVNKANFYIQRIVQLISEISPDGIVQNTITIHYQNESTGEPGGIYKNYLQLYIPAQTTVSSITIDGKAPKEYRQSIEGLYRVVGIWIEVPEQQQGIVKVTYSLEKKIDTTYQLIIQKQIGSINNDFVYEFNPGSEHTIVQTNFPNVVRNGRFVYNTFLEKDRLLLIRLKKQ